MKKFGLALIILAIIFTLVFILMVYDPGLPGPGMSSSGTIDEYGISGAQKDNALKAALAEPSIDRAEYEVDGVGVVKPEDAGYLNVPGYLVKVRLHYMLVGRESIQFDVYVDPATNRTMAVSYYGSPPGPYDWAIVPPGASWYHRTIAWHIQQSGNSSSLGVIVPELHPAVMIEPQNDTAYITIMDEDNFTRLKSGLQYDATIFVDPLSGADVTIKDLPVHGSWYATLTLPAIKEEYAPGTRIKKDIPVRPYYVVLNNGKDNGPDKMTYAMPGYL